MDVLIVAVDSRGGVQPYTALAAGLQTRGHCVVVAAPEDLAWLPQQHGVPAVALPGSMQEAAGRLPSTEKMRGLVPRGMQEEVSRQAAARTTALLDAAVAADVVLAGIGGAPIARPVAERTGARFLPAHLHPLGPVTGAFPGVLAPRVPRWAGRAGNRLAHRLTALAAAAPTRPAERAARVAAGLPEQSPARPDAGGLYGISPQVLPPPSDWPARHVLTGYWFLDAPAGGLDPELETFLRDGAPPVVVGFGSMSSADALRTSRIVTAALRATGSRGVLLTGWGGLAAEGSGAGLGADVLVRTAVPHELLLPRAAAVVHHAGAGTTAAGLRAGIPNIAVPFGVDQPFWAARIHALGAGPRPIPRSRLTAERLAAALEESLGDESLRERSRRLGAAIRTEDGVRTAVDHLEAWGTGRGTG
ncbi:glycosyltransferase [Kocuria sp. NPDC057446]|uniref:glycosyltransferase n=1 Tax=Kocuria sp. NPDC057446 TaxID=3346137 RepID=UPI0036886116